MHIELQVHKKENAKKGSLPQSSTSNNGVCVFSVCVYIPDSLVVMQREAGREDPQSDIVEMLQL